jgi:uncharacterized protein
VTRVGLISDTHGLLRPEAREALVGCDRIIHAGDVGSQAVLDDLATLAPVCAVRGNNDVGAWAKALPETLSLTVEDSVIHVLHDLAQLDLPHETRGIRAVVSGHSHKPLVREREGVLYVNPGSAGPRRFRLPVSVAHLHIAGDRVVAQITELEVSAPARVAPRRIPNRPRSVRK